jgi:PKD repeat protein
MQSKSIVKNSVKIVLCIFLMMVLVQGVHAAAPVASFTGSPTSGTAPLAVQFTDASSNSPTGWAWFFGDETYTQAWTQQTANTGWSARCGHTSVAMPDGSIVLMGGRNSSSNLLNDVWRSTNNGATWMQQTASAGWSTRWGHTSVAMPDGSIVLIGGVHTSGAISKHDVWQSTDNGATWTQMTASPGWSARAWHTSVALPDGSIVLMGGTGIGGQKNDVWRSTDNGATWTRVTPSAGWSAREQHSSVAMPDGSIVMMGGFDGVDRKNDVWRSTDNGATWMQQTASAGWSARYGHSSVAMPDSSIILMGGFDGIYKNDVWRSTDNGVTWWQIAENAGWLARAWHSSVMNPDSSIILMGGFDNSSIYKNDVWRFVSTGSSFQNPSHTYTATGIFQVALQAFNSAGYNSTRKTGYISVTSPTTTSSVGVFRSGTFYLQGVTNPVVFGLASDTPVTGDWNGDGITEVGVFRSGSFYRNGATSVPYGITGDIPVTGDWNGDTHTEVGVFRSGTFYRYGATPVAYGVSTDTPVTGDWNGDGTTEVGVFRSGTFYRYGATPVAYGVATDTPVTGDWNGDGTTEVGVFRSGTFYLNGVTPVAYGLGSDTPITGKWT